MSLDGDPKFKSDFTRMTGRRVVCRIPANGSVKYREEVIFKPGGEFLFTTQRCYLSSGFYDYIHTLCGEPYRLNMQADFEFFGEMEIVQGDELYRSQSKVPVHWVVATFSQGVEKCKWTETAFLFRSAISLLPPNLV